MVLPVSKADEKELLLSKPHVELFFYFRRKLFRNYTDYGLWVSWKKSMAYLFQPIYQKIIYYLYELDLNKQINPKARDLNYAFRLISPDETDLIDQIEKMEEWLKGSLKKKLQDNCLCMVVLDGNSVIGFNYASVGEGYLPLLKLRILTGPTEAWSEQITISKNYRRQGLGSVLRSHFYQALRARGITALYGHRQEFNHASKQSARKFTVDVLVRTEYRRLLGMHRLKCVKPLPGMPEITKHFFIKRVVEKNGTGKKQTAPIPGEPLFTSRIEDLK
jgi:GNAT superfamily N-acetyltransferase